MIPISDDMKRRFFLAAPLVAVMPLAWPVARAAAAEMQPVTALDGALIRLMKAASAGKSFSERYAMLRPVVEQSFDLKLILQNSAGLLWSQIPAAQKTELQTLFLQYTVATYVSNFASYDGQRFTTSPDIRKVDDTRIVTTDLVAKSGKKTKLSYVVHEADGRWTISDVLFDGTISKVATQRSDFSGLIAPGDASKLIDGLKKKIAALAGGSLKG